MRKNLIFSEEEFQGRVRKTKERMDKSDMEMLLVMDPANMNYLTGYDAALYAGDLARNLWI
jgi:Xaa-Pro dipeptidase